jgi:hypothetical protein
MELQSHRLKSTLSLVLAAGASGLLLLLGKEEQRWPRQKFITRFKGAKKK